jgi:hypothetical protein
MNLAIPVALALLAASPALAHDGGEQDCTPVPAGEVVTFDIFYLAGSSNEATVSPPITQYHIVETGEVLDDERVIWQSPDERWWRCRNLDGERPGSTRYLIGPRRP